VIEIKQSKYSHPNVKSGAHTNGPPNTFIRQQAGKWFVLTTQMPFVGVLATVQRMGFEEFVRVHCLTVEE
jgi:hypothetical protein